MADTDFVHAVNPDGQLVRVPTEDLQRALSQGFQPPSPEQLRALQVRQAAQGPLQGLAAAGEGAASALTFGAAPAIETALGVTTPDAIRARQQQHPIAHAAGTAAGIIAPLVLTGGAAAPAEGAALAGEGALGAARTAAEFTAPALIARAGRAAAGATEGALPGLAGRALPAIAAGATEGGLYSGADLTEKALLKDPQLTWEGAASELGLGALFGGALAGGADVGARGLGKLLAKATDGFQTVAEHLAEGDTAVVKLMFSAKNQVAELERAAPGAAENIAASTPETAQFILKNVDKIKEYEKGFPGLTETLAKADPDTAKLVLDNWDKLLKDPQRRIEVGTALLDSTQSTYSAIEDAFKRFNVEVRPEEQEKLLFGPHTVELPGGGSALEHISAEDAQSEGTRILKSLSRGIADMRAEPDLYAAGLVRQLELYRDSLGSTMANEPTAPAIFQRLRELRQQLDEGSRWDSAMHGFSDRKAAAAFRDLRGQVSESITGPAWGEAGARQKALDKVYSAYFGARDELMSRLGEGPRGAKSISPTKVNAWVNAMADLRGKVKTDAFSDFTRSAKDLADEMERSGLQGAGVIRKQVEAAVARADQVREQATVTQIVKMLQGREILSSGPAVPMGHHAALEAAKKLPFGVGEIVGGIHGTVARLKKPGATVRVLSEMDRLARKASVKLSRGADAIFKSGAGGAAAGEAASGTQQRFAHGGRVSQEGFADAATALRRYGGDLDALAGDVSRETSALQEHAPGTATHAHAFAARVVQHLGGKLPDAGHRQFLDEPFEPSATELAEYNRHHEVAHRGPVAVLDHVARGTLLPEHLETSQALYPKLHAEAQQLVADRLAEHVAAKQRVPLRVREGVGMLLGVDLDHASTGEAALSAQSAYGAPTPPASATQSPGSKRPREVQVRTSERVATGSQGNEVRMGRG